VLLIRLICSIHCTAGQKINGSEHLKPLCRLLLEKLVVAQLVKKLPVFSRTRRFITVFTRVRHWYLSWGSKFNAQLPTFFT